MLLFCWLIGIEFTLGIGLVFSGGTCEFDGMGSCCVGKAWGRLLLMDGVGSKGVLRGRGGKALGGIEFILYEVVEGLGGLGLLVAEFVGALVLDDDWVRVSLSSLLA